MTHESDYQTLKLDERLDAVRAAPNGSYCLVRMAIERAERARARYAVTVAAAEQALHARRAQIPHYHHELETHTHG